MGEPEYNQEVFGQCLDNRGLSPEMRARLVVGGVYKIKLRRNGYWDAFIGSHWEGGFMRERFRVVSEEGASAPSAVSVSKKPEMPPECWREPNSRVGVDFMAATRAVIGLTSSPRKDKA